jgi:hypothetical protein
MRARVAVTEAALAGDYAPPEDDYHGAENCGEQWNAGHRKLWGDRDVKAVGHQPCAQKAGYYGTDPSKGHRPLSESLRGNSDDRSYHEKSQKMYHHFDLQRFLSQTATPIPGSH